jgi:protein LSM14
MDRDYDFESANAKFNKENIAKEVAAQSGSGANGTTSEGEGPSAAQLSAALASNDSTFYDKGKSFFDNISCETKDRNQQHPVSGTGALKRQEERKLNLETFGQASVDSGRYGRGGYRGRGGFRGRGSGGYRVGRGGPMNPWRGGSGPRTPMNGQTDTSSATTPS